ncbi:MAG: GNAT family N-acetyltransferase [Candidatus Lokiarchaeota archaeon]|nr:GNAT family N-acetyltransferase [Candidatus Lokiarchaeota archaeon]MBD3201559.1 GNAT family N-acetyltransferase [Candidatus Lokiarchaeota archaeon]
MVKIIDINESNVDEEDLFCKKTRKKMFGYQNKVKWMKERFKEGLKYKVLYTHERNKDISRGMIEYIPGKYNWRGIQAEGWMVIHCIWVVGKAKQKGYGTKLLQIALEDAKQQGMYGVVGMTAKEKGWLPKKELYVKNGFEKVDEIEPYFELYAKIFDENAPKPQFYPIDNDLQQLYPEKEVIIQRSDQCPYITDLAEDLKSTDKNGKLKVIKLNHYKEAQQNGIYPYGTYCIAYNGRISLYQHRTKKELISLLNN